MVYSYTNIKHLSKMILDVLIKKSNKKPLTVAIAGEGNSGKSTLSSNLKNYFTGTATIIEIDRYIIGRKDRKKIGVSAYNPKAINIQMCSKAINELISRKPVWAPYYDHENGEVCKCHNCKSHPHSLFPSDLLIAEGLFLWHPIFYHDFSLQIYCENSQKECYKSRIERDVKTRNYSESDAISHLKKLKNDVHKYIRPSKDYCDIQLYLKEEYSYIAELTEGAENGQA